MTPYESAVLDVDTQRRDRNQTAKGFPFKLLEETAAAPPAKRHIIKNIFARGETSAWIGPPGSLKSALLASAAIAVPSVNGWFGRRSKEACGVVYFALERADLVERRLQAATKDMRLPIAIVRDVFDLVSGKDLGRVVMTIREAETAFGCPVGLVIVDTFAKLIAAGQGDENSAADQGRVFASIQRIKNATDCHVAIIGHTGKEESRGARGSNAILGDVDLMVMISGDDTKTATVTKANDGPEGPLFSFCSEVHSFGTDEDGDPITVNIVREVDSQQPQRATKSDTPKVYPDQKTFYRILYDAGANGLTLEEWNAKARDVGLGVTRKAKLYDLRKALEDRGMVREYAGRWKVNHEGTVTVVPASLERGGT